ncbi:MAG: hypothetical protein R6V44_03150 [Paracoccaceae bacterium]
MRSLTLALAGFGLGVVAGPASAIESFNVPFENIFPTAGSSESSIDPFVDDFVGVFEADSSTSTSIRLRLENNTSTAEVGDAFISRVYFDHDGLLTNFVVNSDNVGVVDFETLENLSMAQDNKISPPFEAETAYRWSTPGNDNAVQAGEALGFTADLAGGLDFGSFESAMRLFEPIPVRIGMHIQGIDGELSDSIVSGRPSLDLPPITEQPIPVPAALPLAATAMFGLGWFARRRRKAA